MVRDRAFIFSLLACIRPGCSMGAGVTWIHTPDEKNLIFGAGTFPLWRAMGI
jgi:hypothetical protein